MTNREKDSIIDKLKQARPVGQAVKTLASHAENMGSIPVRVTNTKRTLLVGVLFALVSRWNRTLAVINVCKFADTVYGEVRIPPTGGILRRAEIYR